jgi:hypothetical protein
LLGLPIKGVVEKPKSAAEGGSWIEQYAPQIEALKQRFSKKDSKAAASAAGVAVPPPAARVAVNYVANKPKRKAK